MHTMYDFVKEREQAMFEEGQLAGRAEGEKYGRLEGEKIKQKSIVVNMLAKGMASELIEELTGLTEDEKKFKKE